MKDLFPTVFLLAVLLVAGCHSPTEPPAATSSLPVVYKNHTYGFSFSLPEDWRNYSIETTAWAGKIVPEEENQSTNSNLNFHGPTIIIQHPPIPGGIPYQAIPIMVLTPEEWALLKAEKMSASAGGVYYELGRNSRYVFALYSRYNLADAIGTPEVARIIDANQPLKTFF